MSLLTATLILVLITILGCLLTAMAIMKISGKKPALIKDITVYVFYVTMAVLALNNEAENLTPYDKFRYMLMVINVMMFVSLSYNLIRNRSGKIKQYTIMYGLSAAVTMVTVAMGSGIDKLLTFTFLMLIINIYLILVLMIIKRYAAVQKVFKVFLILTIIRLIARAVLSALETDLLTAIFEALMSAVAVLVIAVPTYLVIRKRYLSESGEEVLEDTLDLDDIID